MAVTRVLVGVQDTGKYDAVFEDAVFEDAVFEDAVFEDAVMVTWAAQALTSP